MKKAKRTHEKHLRFSDEEIEILEKKAKASGTSVCKYIRNMALFGEIKVYDLNALTRFKNAVNPIGQNINQIAAKANSTGFMPKEDAAYLKKAVVEIKNLIAEKLADIKPQIF